VARSQKRTKGTDPTWPEPSAGEMVVSELVTDRQGSLSPFGEVTFPVPAGSLPYQHPVTVVNRPSDRAPGRR
jgi:hypothetical protein